MVSRGWGGRGNGEFVFNVYRVSAGEAEIILEMDDSGGFKTTCMYLMAQKMHLEMVKMKNFVMCILPELKKRTCCILNVF